MKTSFSFGLILLVGFLLWMTSCDKVDAPYRTTTSVGVVYINNDTVVIDGDTLGFNSDNTNPGKKYWQKITQEFFAEIVRMQE